MVPVCMALTLKTAQSQTLDAETAPVQDMGIDHCRSHILVTQKLLYGANVITIFQQVGREAVSKRMTASVFLDAGDP